MFRGLIQKGFERGDVLMQLATGHESTVAAKGERLGGGRDLLRLVGVAEQKFASRERPPIAFAVQGAVAFLERPLVAVWILPLENRIADCVGKAEMFLRRGRDGAVRVALQNRRQILELLSRLALAIMTGKKAHATSFQAKNLHFPGFRFKRCDG